MGEELPSAEMPPPHPQEVIPGGHVNLAFTLDENPLQTEPDDSVPEHEFKPRSKDKKQKKNTAEESKELVKTVGIFQLYCYATFTEVLLMLFALLCAVLNGAGIPLMCIVFGQMVDSFVSGGQQSNVTGNFTGNSTGCGTTPGVDIEGPVRMSAYYFVGISAGVVLMGTLQVMLFIRTAVRQTKRIREKYFHAVLHQQMAWFDTHAIGELNTRLTDDINTISEGLGDKICVFVQFFCRFVFGILVGLIYGWKLTLVVLSISPVFAVSSAVLFKVLASLTSKELSAYAKAGAVAEEILVAIRTVVAFNGQQKAVQKYEASLVDAKNLGVKKAITVSVFIGLTQFFLYATYALAFWYGTKLSVDEPENYSIGRVLTVFFTLMIGIFSLGQGAPNLESIAKARAAAYTIYNTIDTPRPIDSSSNEGYKPDSVKGDIEFKNIHFTYPSRNDVKILQGLSLKIPRGKTIALVGASGCGKSTTIQLLLRFYDPDAGEVTVDGRDIRTLNVRWLRENVGIVSQEAVLFGTTIAENIRYGREDATDEDIERAVKEANAYDFISKLPHKLNTMVGERGAQLSGGQKQRIAIARALVKNPKILLLDEATSALDPQSESIVQAALDKARAGRTTIVIAHRLSTVRTADVIAGFKDGQVVEQGSHSELMNKKGVYYSLVMQQGMMGLDDQSLSNYSLGKNYQPCVKQPSERMSDGEDKKADEIFSKGETSMGSSDGEHTIDLEEVTIEKEEEKVPEVPFGRILALNKPEWLYIMVGTLASLVGGTVYPSVGILFSKITGVFAETDLEVKQQESLLFSLLFLLLGALAFITNFFQGYMFGKSGEILTMRLRSQSFKAFLRQDIGWFDDHNNAVGVLTTKLATEAALVKGATGSTVGMATSTVCGLCIAVIVAFCFCWQLTILIVVCVPFLIGSGFIQVKTGSGHISKDQSALEESGKIFIEAVENIRTLVALAKEDIFLRKFSDSLQEPYLSALNNAPINGIIFGLAHSIPELVKAAVFCFGAWLITHCYAEYENVYLVFSVVFVTAMSIGQSSSFALDFGKAKTAAWKILDLLQKTPEIDIYSEAGDKPMNLNGNIEFCDVHFSYPTRTNVKVLQGLNMSLSKGQTLALVGGSGCGKSTTIQLLERFYNPASGQVLLDGSDTRRLNIAWLRSQLGLVSQEPILFDCTIAENIQYGDNSREVSHQEIIEAATSANIHDFIMGLPEKYNTRVGDKGAQLSGGQKQRIAIARALVRNPKVLLLDEATSALDTESEKIVQKALDDACQGRTCIVIAHRLSTIQNADIIAVIQNGQVCEQGSHNELMYRQGAYYALVNAQVSH